MPSVEYRLVTEQSEHVDAPATDFWPPVQAEQPEHDAPEHDTEAPA